MQRWVERSEARWALWAGVAGAVATAVLSTKMILAHRSVVGFIVLPLIAAVAAVPIAVWGAALGHVVAHLRGRAAEPKIVFWAALVAALSVPVALGYAVWDGKSLEHAVRETRAMDAAGLERAFLESPHRRNKYFLGALAAHPKAGAPLLDAIAGLEDPELFQPMWSLWDVMEANPRGLPVMQLVAQHANVSKETQASLSSRAPR